MSKTLYSPTQQVYDSRARNNVSQYNLCTVPDETLLLEEMAAQYGGKKAAIIAGLSMLRDHQTKITSDDIIAWIRKNG